MKQQLIETFKEFRYMELNIFNLIIKSCLDGWGNGIPRNEIVQTFRECLDNNDEFVKTRTTKGGFYAIAGYPAGEWDRNLAKDVFSRSAVSHVFVEISGEKFYKLLNGIEGSGPFEFVEAMLRTLDAECYWVEKHPSNAFVRELRKDNDYFEYAKNGKGKGIFIKRNSTPASGRNVVPVQKKQHQSRKSWLDDYEYIYVLVNPRIPGHCKIGRSNDTIRRAKELSSQTSAPDNFKIFYQLDVENAKKTEREIHNLLKDYRVPSKEYFEIAPEEARRKIEDFLQGH